jgi:STE24 endopeptidase
VPFMKSNRGNRAGAGVDRLPLGRCLAVVLVLALGTLAMAWTANAAQPAGSRADRSPHAREQKALATYQLSRERYDKAVSYARKGYTLYFVSAAWGMLALLALLRLRVVSRLREAAQSVSGKRWIQGLIFVPCLMLLLALLHLPISIYWHSLSLRYEQSIQSWGSWFWDWSKSELLGLALGYIEEKYPGLVEAIGKLTERAGVPIPAERMFLMQASAKTNQINAYVTGVGASKRVVVWDTTIEKSQPDEVMAVVGHELGHYVLGHVWKGFLFFTGGLLVGLYVAYRALNQWLRLWGNSWGVHGQTDWAALAVLLLILRVMEFVGSPIGNAFSRMEEHAADVYGLEVTHGIVPNSQQAAAEAFQRMGEIDLADPNPSRFITFWLYSHPPLGERLSFAHHYDPWSKGEEPKYIK